MTHPADEPIYQGQIDTLQRNLNGLTGRWRLLDAACAEFNRRSELDRATWEPHDWSDFS